MEIVPVVPNCSSGGNTKTPQISPAKQWCFTLNNYSQNDFTSLCEFFSSNGAYIIGEEVGAEGTPHLQGYIRFNKKCRPLSLNLNPKIHWEKCKGSEVQNIAYCSKDGKFSTNINIPVPKKPVKTLTEAQLYNWQKEIIEIIKQPPDDRSIYWYWEENGNMGKTTFAKYLALTYKAIPIEGKKTIYYIVPQNSNLKYIYLISNEVWKNIYLMVRWRK